MQMGNASNDVYYLIGFGFVMVILTIVPAYFIFKHNKE